MPSLSAIGTLTAALCSMLSYAPSQVYAAPTAHTGVEARQASGSGFWMADIKRQGSAWGNTDNYNIFRNVKDFGATGDGSTDDTAAINKAISSSQGNARCGNEPWCDSSTTTPAIVYFPPGTYIVSKPVVMYYYTQLIGDANTHPVIKGAADFEGMALLDADPYNSTGLNWWTNQNNFFRQVRNFDLDMTGMPESTGAGIHWQVAQATSLQHINFHMAPKSKNNKQQGIFMDNGSGGFFSDLNFYGGNYGAFVGSQQFTTRNLHFEGCNTGMFMNWNWGWTISNASFSDCDIGLDTSSSPQNQTVGSTVLSDSSFTNTGLGIQTAWKPDANVPVSGGQLIVDNVDFSGAQVAIARPDKTQYLGSAGKVSSWTAGDGYIYDGSGPIAKNSKQGTMPKGPTKAASILDSNGNIFGRSKPQYENVPASSFVSAKSFGCKGDGKTDDTQMVQNFLNSIQQGQIAYFDHGAYIVSNTIKVPKSIKIVGEIWSMIVATGFTDVNNPKAVFQVGQKGDTGGAVEISDMIFETKGPNPGAVMIEWNLASAQGASGMWDSHVRIGGSYGTDLNSETCTTRQQGNPSPDCEGVFLMLHVTSSAKSVLFENTWFWVADHDLDLNSPVQISIYSGRGVLIESQGPTWLWGTASEHSLFYNYQFKGASAIFSGFMQSETPYYQPVPAVPTPFQFNDAYDDPKFTVCNNASLSTDAPCKDAWGLRIWESNQITLYSTGLYSFFNNYEQTCTPEQNCQQNMIHIQNSQVDMYAVSTKAAVNMIVDDDVGNVLDADHRSNFCATIAYYFTTH